MVACLSPVRFALGLPAVFSGMDSAGSRRWIQG